MKMLQIQDVAKTKAQIVLLSTGEQLAAARYYLKTKLCDFFMKRSFCNVMFQIFEILCTRHGSFCSIA